MQRPTPRSRNRFTRACLGHQHELQSDLRWLLTYAVFGGAWERPGSELSLAAASAGLGAA